MTMNIEHLSVEREASFDVYEPYSIVSVGHKAYIHG